MSAYFATHSLGVVSGTETPETTLFDTVREKVTNLQTPQSQSRLSEIDRKICDSLLHEIGVTGEGQTRERLHLAIYDGKLPHYYNGVPEETVDGDASARHAWRHLINTLYNFNLASRFRSRPILNSRWFRIPKHLITTTERAAAGRLEKIGEVKLETPVYPAYLTVDFVAAVRREKDFWKTLGKMERAQVSHNDSAYESAFEEHLQLVSSLFKQHLKHSSRDDLVKTSLAEVWIKLVPRTLFGFAAAEVALALWSGLPWGSIGALVGGALPVQGVANLVVNGFIAALPIRVTHPRFKSFEAELTALAHETRLSP